MRTAGVLFDLYETLVEADWDSFREPLTARLGVEVPVLEQAYDDTRPARDLGKYGSPEEEMSAIVSAAGRDPDPELVRDLISLTARFFSSEVRLHSDVSDVLAEFDRRGVRTVLVSNCSHETQPLLERLGLARRLDALVLSFQVGACKPDPAIYTEALSRIDASPEEAVFVDDQPHYCDAAAALGMQTRLIKRNGHRPLHDAPGTPNAHPVIQGLGELLAE